MLPNVSIDYPFFCGDLLNAVKNSSRVNILPYDSETSPFTDRICDMDITVVGNMEEITLNFENHEPFRFKLNHLEIKQPSNGKYYVNDGQSGQQINILFLDNRQ